MNEMTRISRSEADSALVPFTADDYERMYAEGAFGHMRIELVGGVLEKMLPAHWGHGEYQFKIGAALIAAYRGTRFGVAGDVMVRIDDHTVRAPDAVVALPDPPRDRAVSGEHLLLAVEIFDTSGKRDLIDKPDDYARGGVPNYWAVDINKRVAHVFGQPVDGTYTYRTLTRFGEMLTAPEIGIPIPLD